MSRIILNHLPCSSLHHMPENWRKLTETTELKGGKTATREYIDCKTCGAFVGYLRVEKTDEKTN